MVFGKKTLQEVIIPDSVTSIGESTFRDCICLASITIPNSVTTIGGSAFYNCRGLTSINFTGTLAQWNRVYREAEWNEDLPAPYVQCSDGTARW